MSKLRNRFSRFRMRIFVEGKLREFEKRQSPSLLENADLLTVALALVEVSRVERPIDLAGLMVAGQYFWARHTALSPSDRRDFEFAVSIFNLVAQGDVSRVPPDALPFLEIPERRTSETESHAATQRGTGWLRRAEQNGDIEAAEKAAEEFRLAVRSAEKPHQAAQSFNNLGIAWRVKFDLTGNVEHLNEAIEATRHGVDLFEADHPLRGAAVNSLGALLMLRARCTREPSELDAAILLLREAREAIEPEGDCVPPNLSNLAMALLDRFQRDRNRHDLDEAIALLRQARRLIPANDPSQLTVESNLATALFARYKHTVPEVADLDEAISLLRSALARTATTDSRRHKIVINASNILLTRFRLRGNPDDALLAERLLRETMAGLEFEDQRYGEVASHLSGAVALLEEASQSPDPHGRAAVRAAVPAAPRTPQALLTWAYANADSGRAADSIRELKRVAYSATASIADRIEVSIVWAHITTASDPAEALTAYTMALELLPQLAIRQAADLSRMHVIGEYNGIPSEAASLALELGQRQTAVEILEQGRALWWMLNTGTDVDSPVADSLPQRPTFDELRMAASEGPVIILNAGTRRCDALIVTVDDLIVVPLDVSLLDLRDRTIEFALLWSTDVVDPPHRDRRFEREVTDALEWLTRHIVEPVIAQLRTADLIAGHDHRVWWCPTGVFAMWPWHACALDDMVSSYAPTLRALLDARKRVPRASVSPHLLSVGVADSPELRPLPNAEAEAQEVAGYFAGTPTVLLGAQASRARVLAELPHAAWFHVACHARQFYRNPLDGGLELSDVRLTVADLMNSTITSGELAFLSACETAQATFGMSDELLTVAMALHQAGFPSVVATGWMIDDADALVVSRSVYQNLTATGRPDGGCAALAVHRETQRLRAVYPRQPSAWAAYLHIGI